MLRFILLAHERTGTTVFRGLVNQHPSVFIYGEMCFPSLFEGGWYSHLAAEADRDKSVLLPRERGAHFIPYLSQLAQKEEQSGRKAIGFDVKIEQTGLIGHFNHTVQQSAFGILHLRRMNTLAAIVSNVTMEARMNRGLPPHDTKQADNEPVHLDPEWLKLRIDEHELQDRQVMFTHKNQPFAQILYEEFTTPAGWRTTCNRLSGFFNFVFEVPFKPAFAKQNTSNLAELITNADEIRRRFPRYFET